MKKKKTTEIINELLCPKEAREIARLLVDKDEKADREAPKDSVVFVP